MIRFWNRLEVVSRSYLIAFASFPQKTFLRGVNFLCPHSTVYYNWRTTISYRTFPQILFVHKCKFLPWELKTPIAPPPPPPPSPRKLKIQFTLPFHAYKFFIFTSILNSAINCQYTNWRWACQLTELWLVELLSWTSHLLCLRSEIFGSELSARRISPHDWESSKCKKRSFVSLISLHIYRGGAKNVPFQMLWFSCDIFWLRQLLFNKNTTIRSVSRFCVDWWYFRGVISPKSGEIIKPPSFWRQNQGSIYICKIVGQNDTKSVKIRFLNDFPGFRWDDTSKI